MSEDSIESLVCHYTDRIFLRSVPEPRAIILAPGLFRGAGAPMIDQPYVYRHKELVEPDWQRLPGWADVTTDEWASAQWQRAHCIKNIRQLRQVIGDGLDESFLADLERDQAERATMSMLVPPQMVNTNRACFSLVASDPRLRTDAFYADLGSPVHDPGLHRPADRLAFAPGSVQGLTARGRDVGRRGSHPPLPHQGAGRAAAHLPAVLRPLHPDGPGRQPHAADREAQVRHGPRGPARRDARLPARHPRRPRCRCLAAATWPTCPGPVARVVRRLGLLEIDNIRDIRLRQPRPSWACRSTG